MQEPICRFSDVNKRDHETHFPPYSNLGPLTSHIHPHVVVFNTGQKLSSALSQDVLEMSITLDKMVAPLSDALLMMFTIQRLYRAWTEVQVPEQFSGTSGTLNRFHRRSQAEGGRDDHSQGGPPRRPGLRSATRRSQGQVSPGHYEGGQQRAILPLQPPEDDDSLSITDDTVLDDDTAWIEHIHSWQKQGEEGGVAESEESGVPLDSCDGQLAAYIEEHARTPPSPGVWDSWKPAWDDHGSRYPSASDRAQFSSNDWAVFKNDVYLTRPGHPRVTT